MNLPSAVSIRLNIAPSMDMQVCATSWMYPEWPRCLGHERNLPLGYGSFDTPAVAFTDLLPAFIDSPEAWA